MDTNSFIENIKETQQLNEMILSCQEKIWIQTIENIVKETQKLNELKLYEEHRANDDITEAVLVCCPKVANILQNAIYENNLKDIPIISTPLAEEDKVYMVTDKEVIKRARTMLGTK